MKPDSNKALIKAKSKKLIAKKQSILLNAQLLAHIKKSKLARQSTIRHLIKIRELSNISNNNGTLAIKNYAYSNISNFKQNNMQYYNIGNNSQTLCKINAQLWNSENYALTLMGSPNGQRLDLVTIGGKIMQLFKPICLRWKQEKQRQTGHTCLLLNACARTIVSMRRLGTPLGAGSHILNPVRTLQRGVRL